MARKHYTLTLQAEENLRQAKSWSLSRWGKALTRQYFADLHEGAEYIAANYSSLGQRDELAETTGLCVYPVREHYIVYMPVAKKHIVIVAFIRQGRDVPAILLRNSYRILRELKEIRARMDSGDLEF